MQIHNFNAGPSLLPIEILNKCSHAVKNFNNLNYSILEISHRSQTFNDLFYKTVQKIKKIANLGKDYEVLFLQGGASLQFAMVPYNLIKKKKGVAAYLDTGIWSSLAIEEAKKIGQVYIIASSKNNKYNRIPISFKFPKKYDYCHITTNNTVFGTQIKDFSKFRGILVADMSSDIFSRNINFNKFDLIYAGAQKNLGCAGVSVVIIKKRILSDSEIEIPSYLDYKIHISKNGIFNTPNIFGIYVLYQMLHWIEKSGGIIEIEKNNIKKANLIYDEIDRNSLFKGYSVIKDRSNMNITFNLKDINHSKYFDMMCEKAGILGLKGHRLLGGYRASVYNAMTFNSIEVLVNTMQEFEKSI